jgi:hypothetical protein
LLLGLSQILLVGFSIASYFFSFISHITLCCFLHFSQYSLHLFHMHLPA